MNDERPLPNAVELARTAFNKLIDDVKSTAGISLSDFDGFIELESALRDYPTKCPDVVTTKAMMCKSYKNGCSHNDRVKTNNDCFEVRDCFEISNESVYCPNKPTFKADVDETGIFNICLLCGCKYRESSTAHLVAKHPAYPTINNTYGINLCNLCSNIEQPVNIGDFCQTRHVTLHPPNEPNWCDKFSPREWVKK